MLTDLEILRDIDRRIATLQNTTDGNLGQLRSEFHLFRQDALHYRRDILERLDELEEIAKRPMIDWNGLWQKLWVQLIILAAFATGNKQLLDLVKSAIGG